MVKIKNKNNKEKNMLTALHLLEIIYIITGITSLIIFFIIQ